MPDDFAYPVAFNFRVSFSEAEDKLHDAHFQVVSGLETEIATEALHEGGENHVTHKFPQAVKHLNLVLNAASSNPRTLLFEWFKDTLEAS